MRLHTSPERITKLLVLSSLGAAIGLTAFVGSSTRPELVFVFPATFLAGFLLSFVWAGAVAAALAVAYVVPAFVFVCLGAYSTEYHMIWAVALFGVIARESWTRAWMLPRRWTLPLVGWALVIAVTWPLIVAREIDFNLDLLTSASLPSSTYGIRTPTTVLLVLETAITLLLSFVWLDWLFARFQAPAERSAELASRPGEAAFEHRVLLPLFAGCAVACVAAAYQLFGNMGFLNTDFRGFGRASGTMVDANAFGMVAALCGGAIIAWAATPGTNRNVPAALGAGLMWAGAWASGSRTSLVATMITLAFVLASLFNASDRELRHRRRIVAVGASVVLFVLVLIVSMASFPRVFGATRRLSWVVPSPNGPSIREIAKLMWDRDGYGVGALRMFRESPVFGVGVGSFPILVPDFGVSRFGGPLVPDNAQNWIRHQLTELGVLGSLGWLAWAWVFVHFMMTSRAPPGRAVRTGIIGGVLVATVVVSQVGLPTQSVTVAVTFWTLVFWYSASMRAPGAPGAPVVPVAPVVNDALPVEAPVVHWKYWALVAAIVVVDAAGTLAVGATTLRVPMRARQFGWAYDYGFYSPEPDGRGGEHRWAQKRAVAVVPAESPNVKLTISVNRHDIATSPVHARVWHDDRLVIDTVLRDLTPVTTFVRISHDPQWLMLTTEVDRVIVPSYYGVADDRELGLAVGWTFLPETSK